MSQHTRKNRKGRRRVRHYQRQDQKRATRTNPREPWGPWTWKPRSEVPGTDEWIMGGWVNQVYIVVVSHRDTAWGPVELLMIRRRDGRPAHNWADFQRIKNEVAGPDRPAVEVYPPESEVVDDVNMYHLWVFPPTFELPLSINGEQSDGHE